MDGLSDAWCSSAIEVFQPAMAFEENAIMEFRNADNKTVSTKNDKNMKVEDSDLKNIPQWKFDDVKSWLWLQQAIHPELDYDLNIRKKWVLKVTLITKTAYFLELTEIREIY
ncbi:putative VAN3-binding protein [Dioscorea sansibarensis]